MNNTIDKAGLLSSFKSLQRDARCEDDVKEWISRHAFLLPGLVTHRGPIPDLEMSSYTSLSDSSAHIGMTLDVYYSAPDTSDPADYASASHANWFGQHVRTTVMSGEPGMTNYAFRLWQDPLEWTYVCALTAHYFLDGGPARTGQLFTNFAHEAWPAMFPNLPWETLVGMYSSGLFPEDKQECIDWLCSLQSQQHIVAVDFKLDNNQTH